MGQLYRLNEQANFALERSHLYDGLLSHSIEMQTNYRITFKPTTIIWRDIFPSVRPSSNRIIGHTVWSQYPNGKPFRSSKSSNELAFIRDWERSLTPYPWIYMDQKESTQHYVQRRRGSIFKVICMIRFWRHLPGGTHILRHTGTLRPFGSFFFFFFFARNP